MQDGRELSRREFLMTAGAAAAGAALMLSPVRKRAAFATGTPLSGRLVYPQGIRTGQRVVFRCVVLNRSDRAVDDSMGGSCGISVDDRPVRWSAALRHPLPPGGSVKLAPRAARLSGDEAEWKAEPGRHVVRAFWRSGHQGAPEVEIDRATVTVAGPRYRRGINDTGGDDGVGAYGVRWHFDGSASLAYLRSKGIDIVRVPFLWENLQPALMEPLDPGALAEMQAMVARVHGQGLQAVLDCHNYARYTTDGITYVLGDGTLSVDDLSDLWTRLSAVFRGNAGVYAYGLMNEPHNLPSSPGIFTRTNSFYTFASSTSGWSASGDTPLAKATVLSHSTSVSMAGSGSLQVSFPAGTTSCQLTDGDPDGVVDRSATPVLSAWVLIPDQGTGLPGKVSAKLLLQNRDYQYESGDYIAITPGIWTQLFFEPSDSTLAESRALSIQFFFESPVAAPFAVGYVDNYTGGSLSGAVSGAQAWQAASQSVLNAIRSSGDSTLVMVSGYNWSSAAEWATTHPAPWIDDPARHFKYEAHYYPSAAGNGDFQSYAEETAAALAAGYSDPVDRASRQMEVFTSWVGTYGVDGYLGETGWPNNSDPSLWNTVGDAVYSAADDGLLDVTYWNASEWSASYHLAAYEPVHQVLSTAMPPSSVIEAHPSILS